MTSSEVVSLCEAYREASEATDALDRARRRVCQLTGARADDVDAGTRRGLAQLDRVLADVTEQARQAAGMAYALLGTDVGEG